MVGFLIKFVIGLILLILALGFARTWQEENSDNGKVFVTSHAPSEVLDGPYIGSVTLPVKVTWKGKFFNASSSTGVNLFDDGNGDNREAYPFTTFMGLIGKSSVLYIEYNQPDN